MNHPFTRSNLIYSASLDGDHIVLVRSQVTRNGLEHRQVWSGTLNPDDAQRRDLQCVLAAAASEQAVFSCLLPFADGVSRRLTTPFASLKKAQQVFPALLNIQLPFDLATCQYLFLETNHTNGGVQTLAVAARNENIQAQLDLYARLEINPVYLHYEGVAFWNQCICEEPPAADHIPRIICHMGTHRTILLYGTGTTYCRGGHINMGSQQIGSDHEALTTWTSRAMLNIRAFPLPTDQTLNWYWCGTAAQDSQLLTQCENELFFHDAPTYHTLSNPGLFSARAQSEPIFRRQPTANLRTNQFVHPLVNKACNRKRNRSSMMLIMAGILLLLMNMAWLIKTHTQKADSQAQITVLTSQLAPGTVIPRGMEIFKLRQILDERNRSMATFKAMHDKRQETLLAQIITICKTEAISIEQIILQSGEIKISGSADNWRAGDKLEELLISFGYQAQQKRSEVINDEPMPFTITGVLHVE